MEIKYPRFSWRLLRNFLLSTAIPIALFTFLLAHSYQKEYNADVSTLVSTTLDTTARNLHTYLAELEQASLMPYYEESFSLSSEGSVKKAVFLTRWTEWI